MSPRINKGLASLIALKPSGLSVILSKNGELDSDLWAFLLNRVLAISVVLEGAYLTLALSLKRYRMAFNIVLISLFYIITAITWRWEWL